MTGLVAFITARLDEDEALASGRACSEWKVIGSRVYLPLGGGSRLVAEFSGQPSSEPPAAEHVARHDPARVLRDVTFGRDLIAFYVQAVDLGAERNSEILGYVLASFARRWAGHPDYAAAVAI